MDGYEATRIVFSRIQNLDPENASQIMGLLLIQDHGEKEMIRLAFGPEALVHSLILKAKKELGLPSNSPPTSPSPYSRLSNGIKLAPPPPITIPNPSSSSSASSLPFYPNGDSDPIEDFQLQDQLSFLNDGSSPTHNNNNSNSDLFYPPHSDLSSSPSSSMFPSSYSWGGSPLHRRSCSVNDANFLGSEDPNSALGWKPCLYFARGYCKNGTSCRFLHGGDGDGGGIMVGSPNNNQVEMMEQCHELFRSKSVQQQRLAAAASQLMASSPSFPYSPKSMNFLLQNQQNDTAQRAALMMSEDLHKFGRSRFERNEFSLNSPTSIVNPASRQIYLTFPADSSFREEDVSNYFSIYGPVQDVRIPYQQKRMFGFVTFVYPETVKLILSKGNPHFVCDARVLVKPYKEKGKLPDKKQQQQLVDRGDFSPCGTPTGLLDARDQFDLQPGGRMFYNTQDMLWRRKMEEQADLQQALELQSRRLMGLQLLDIKKQHHRTLSTGSPIPSPTHSPNIVNQNLVLPTFHSTSEAPEVAEIGSTSAPASTVSVSVGQQLANISIGKEVVANGENGYSQGNGKQNSNHEDHDLQECLEHNLPDSLFTSPTKAAGDYMAPFSNGPNEAIDSDASAVSANSKFDTTSSLLPSASALDMGFFKSLNCQIPRFPSGHGTIGMFAGASGPIGI